MAGGTRVGRQWVLVMDNGEIAIDWGDDIFQNTMTGMFFKGKAGLVSHTVTDDELTWLMRIGRVLEFDSHEVSFPVLPDRPIDLLG